MVVRCAVEMTDVFIMQVDLNQGPALSPSLFAAVKDREPDEVQ